jgi:hypothetical protein
MFTSSRAGEEDEENPAQPCFPVSAILRLARYAAMLGEAKKAVCSVVHKWMFLAEPRDRMKRMVATSSEILELAPESCG